MAGTTRRPARQRPGTAGPVTEAEAESYIHGICFKTGPPSRIGAELEWFLYDAHDPALHIDPGRLAEAVAGLERLPLNAALTREPGGQIELSSRPAETLAQCVEETSADLVAVRSHLRARGLVAAGHGHDPWRTPRRVLDLPRYAAMEEYFDRGGPAGRSMMCSTASVQVCVDAGTDIAGPHGIRSRWLLAHLLGPVLVAAFANSPLRQGRPSGWRSTRQAVWSRMDTARTLAPPLDRDPRAAWARYALDAPLMCIRQQDGQPWTAPPGLTFRGWIEAGGPAGSTPTLDDLCYHLTTLFPPVRPQGHLELRMIDAQSGDDGWIVPLAVVAALFDDPVAHEAALRAVLPLGAGGTPAPRNPLWLRAARRGLTDPALRRAADACFRAAMEALPRMGAPGYVQATVTEFAERYIARGRCPADDLIDQVRSEADRSPARTGTETKEDRA
ncbi:ergothioneine biosynthesis glutamate--cysteine ligase EgtA [Streptomyces sp. H10-C2]|uniref:ergothioneine biosynthesis glutamate--cysteine ligase EgtA n=1 Tax=unclassified Streptomyces TaxID=2593676 RepID=UPI0024BB9195|nr:MULTISPECIES: ergothioneine biosynthesis glutamate--cysteine ligase EgtA [unclassified Streptomyces]MDJ0343555.1 ergothioneine biosynthesis glutamate--cysteine ligase EgtA [Streptomyces sp. PH10-H1]MDJ0368869.1 ergothioneine biosynthesis glutamate--cysteine ligase EgtA [Streptomyces sp. H10-C2]